MKRQKVILSGLFTLAGLVVFVLGSPYYRVFPTNWNQVFYIGMAVFFLALAIILRRVTSLSRFAPPAYAMFIASAALVFLKTGVFNLPENSSSEVVNLAIDKLSQFLHVVPVILALTLLVGEDLGSLFIKKGSLKQTLTFGVIWFVVFTAAGIIIAAKTSDFLPALLKGAPWLLLWAFANATMEELWFRAIFLKRFHPLIGRLPAILVTSLVFGASHINATYDFPGDGFVFGVVVFSMGWIGAHAMLKDDSLIGSILFHAGYDMLILVPVLESMT